MDFTSFSHGQIQSKLWLCEMLEKYIPFPMRTAVVGSWYNILGFLLLVRKQDLYEHIHGFDIDKETLAISDKICDAWMINQNQKIRNIRQNAQDIDFSCYDLVISTSIEDIQECNWYKNLAPNTLVCLQTIDLSNEITSKYPNWNTYNHIPDIKTFKDNYPLRTIYFEGTQEYDYTHLKYNRFMLIGKT